MHDVHFEVRPPLAHVQLDRPQALNALDRGMIEDLRRAVTESAEDARVRAVIVSGAGGRAFCAGGDVRSVVLDLQAEAAGKSDGALARAFFLEEYALNHAIARLAKPWVALLDGIVMGGGAGISVHGSHRVATERTVFAMPETAIGFFPDVGASFFLSRCPGEIGTWLALTGARVGAADLLTAGLATHAVPAAALPAITDELARASWDAPARAVVDGVLARHALAAPALPSVLGTAAREVIDRCFRFDRVTDILSALAGPCPDEEGAAFAAAALATLRAMSPTSLVITLALLRAGKTRTLEEALVAEHRATRALRGGSDFVEGVRALLIDKDKRPRWRPARVEDVDAERLRAAISAPVADELSL